MIMIHPDLINAWSVAGMNAAEIPTASAWFGLYDINLVGYQGHVIPVIIAVWLMSFLEKKLHKIVPEIIDLFVTPLVTVMVTGYVTLTVIGPVFSTVENWVLSGARMLIGLPFGLGGLIIGGVYAITVVAGVHHMYNAIEAGLLSAGGLNIWMPIATAANVGQGAAALALALKTKNKKTKSMALPASLSAFLGITEPAIFGVNIRYMRPFVAGCIGGACGGLIAGLFGVGATAYGITGVFGFLITTQFIGTYALVMAVSAAVAFALSWIMYKEAPAEQNVSGSLDETGVAAPESDVPAEVKQTSAARKIVCAPASGEMIPLSEVNDATFAGEILGKGVAVVPSEGRITAPFDGTVGAVFETKHAIGLMSEDGLELLIHVGINTVELNGQHYTAYVSAGDTVKKGQLMLEFDIPAIQKAGYDITTPVIVSNSDDFEHVEPVKTGTVHAGEEVLQIW